MMPLPTTLRLKKHYTGDIKEFLRNNVRTKWKPDALSMGTPGCFFLMCGGVAYRGLFDKDRPTLKTRFTLDNVPLTSQSSRYSSQGL